MAARLAEGVAVGEVFSYVSGLYFRGKLAYARHFAAAGAVYVITPALGLMAPERPIGHKELARMARVGVDPLDRRYRAPLQRDARRLLAERGRQCEYILLGSVATPKYHEPLREVLGPRLRFPEAFIGRGDMSRGGLLLRCVGSGEELGYIGFGPAPPRGPRPPTLAPR